MGEIVAAAIVAHALAVALGSDCHRLESLGETTRWG